MHYGGALFWQEVFVHWFTVETISNWHLSSDESHRIYHEPLSHPTFLQKDIQVQIDDNPIYLINFT